MKTGLVYSDEISGANKFKPSFFLNEGKRIFVELQKNGHVIGQLSDIVSDTFRPGIFKRVFVNDIKHGDLYITAQSMINQDPLDTAKILSTKLTSNLESMRLKKNSILVSCAGTVGNIKLINDNISEVIGSQDIIRVIPYNNNWGFVYAYLSSNPVYNYIQSLIYGSVVTRIEPSAINSIPLYNFDNKLILKVHSLIEESSTLKELAKKKQDEAKITLSNYINISFSKENYKTSSISSKDLLNSLRVRLDPPALINDGVTAMKVILNKRNYKLIGNVSKVFRPGIFKRCYVKDGLSYIKGSEIFYENPFKRCDKLSRSRTPFIEEMALHEGQILVTCAGSVGNIKMITKEYDDKEAIGSQDIIRIEGNDSLYTKEYLFTYLSLPFVYDYIQSMKYGSVIERIEPFHVESIPVVEPTEEISKKITNLIQSYMDCTYKAFKAEEEAISMVEAKIEKWNKH